LISYRGRRLLISLVIGAFIASASSHLAAQAPVESEPATQLAGREAILMGTDWYPEQWPESRWETDLRLMESSHIQVARIGEFAWSRMEPSEGQFEFDWLDRSIRQAEKHHIAIVLGTPTATPPAWLTQKYPETLRVGENGQMVSHGNRAHASVTKLVVIRTNAQVRSHVPSAP